MTPRTILDALSAIPVDFESDEIDEATQEKFHHLVNEMNAQVIKGGKPAAENVLEMLRVRDVHTRSVGSIACASNSNPQRAFDFLTLLRSLLTAGISPKHILEILENKPYNSSLGVFFAHYHRNNDAVIMDYFNLLDSLWKRYIKAEEIIKAVDGSVPILGKMFLYQSASSQRRFMDFLELLMRNGLPGEKIKKFFKQFKYKTYGNIAVHFEKYIAQLYFFMQQDALADHIYPWLKHLKPQLEAHILSLGRKEEWQACWDILFADKPIYKLANQSRAPWILRWLPFFQARQDAGMFKRMRERREKLLQEMDNESHENQMLALAQRSSLLIESELPAPPPTFCSIDDEPAQAPVQSNAGNIYPQKVGDSWLPPDPAAQARIGEGLLIDFNDFNHEHSQPAANNNISEDLKLLMQITVLPSDIARLQEINVPKEDPVAEAQPQSEAKSKSTEKETRMALRA